MIETTAPTTTDNNNNNNIIEDLKPMGAPTGGNQINLRRFGQFDLKLDGAHEHSQAHQFPVTCTQMGLFFPFSLCERDED